MAEVDRSIPTSLPIEAIAEAKNSLIDKLRMGYVVEGFAKALAPLVSAQHYGLTTKDLDEQDDDDGFDDEDKVSNDLPVVVERNNPVLGMPEAFRKAILHLQHSLGILKDAWCKSNNGGLYVQLRESLPEIIQDHLIHKVILKSYFHVAGAHRWSQDIQALKEALLASTTLDHSQDQDQRGVNSDTSSESIIRWQLLEQCSRLLLMPPQKIDQLKGLLEHEGTEVEGKLLDLMSEWGLEDVPLDLAGQVLRSRRRL